MSFYVLFFVDGIHNRVIDLSFLGKKIFTAGKTLLTSSIVYHESMSFDICRNISIFTNQRFVQIVGDVIVTV